MTDPRPDLIEGMARAIRQAMGFDQLPPTVQDDYGFDNFDEQAQAALQFLHDQGMVIVPREPTEAMSDAFDERYLSADASWADAYAAMIAAAPSPQPNPEEM